VFYGPERFRDDAALVQGGGDAHGGDEVRSGETHGEFEPHESPWTMYVPLIALALLSVVGGFIDLPFTNAKINVLDRWLDLPESHVASSFGAGLVLSTVALVIGVIGIVWAVRVYRNGLRRDGTDPTVVRLGGFAGVLQNAWYIDIGVSRFVSGPATAFARFLSEDVERGGIDGAVNGVAAAARGGGGGLRRLQTGLVRNYALGIALGTVLLLLYVATRVTL
jgi:NADH-quinone oxidoreductase subunit L